MLVVSLSAVARQSAFSGLPDFAFTDDDIGFSFLAIRSLLPEAKGDKKEKNMELREDAIVEIPVVEIPQARLRFFGGPGKMLLPSPATVAALLAACRTRVLT